MRQKIILDCDPGHDDAIALLLAAHHPSLELLAVTTVAGNQSIEKTTQNALKVCSLANIRNVPVAMGMGRPLIQPAHYSADIHGDTGMDGPNIPDSDIEPVSRHAVDLLIDLLMNSAGDITLVPTGPLTNIATAMRREPAIVSKIQAISLMGGAIGIGNVTPSAEFNLWCDPHAAAIVFGCGRPITMVPLEVTHQALATEDVLHRLRGAQRPVPTFVADLLAFFGESYKNAFGFPAPPVHDPCAVAAVFEPEILQAADMYVAIDITSPLTIGRSVCDVYGKLGKPANARVGYDLNVERFWAATLEVLLSY